MGKIGKGLVKKQKENRESSGFVAVQKVLDIKKHGGTWHRFAKDEIHKINIIPWKIKSKKDLAVQMKGDFHKDVGDYVYSLNYWVHPRMHEEKDILCRKKSFGQSCSICDEAQKKWDIYNNNGKTDDQKKAANALNPKLRSMYNIEVLNDAGKGKNAFYEASDYIFEDPLLEKATECEDGAEPVAFYEIDSEEGKIVKFKAASIPRDPMKSFEFRDRKKPISKKLLEGVLPFGELVEIPTKAEVDSFFYGNDFVEDEDDDDDDYDEDEDTIEEELDSTDEDEDEDDDSVEEEDDDDDDDKPVGKSDICPSKKKFGIEFGDFEECDECPVEKDCYKQRKALKKKEVAKSYHEDDIPF